MKFPERWLREFCDSPLSAEELGERLTMAGLELESLEPVAPPFTGVVTARILSAEPHPNADKLRVCQVDVGGEAPLQIVCGAPNARAGIVVPCALVGAQLPGGLAIKRAKLRGVESQGMLCSARELGLSEDHSGLLELDPALPVGADVRQVLELDEAVFDVSLTPNRADCLSILGIAREVSALTEAPLHPPRIDPVAATLDAVRPIRLAAPEACPRYLGRVIRGVDAKRPTPEWMRRRLERSGVRAIHLLVDITNYVMLELGQPLHAFDEATLQGGITVRWAQPGETLALLNEQRITLAPDVLVIADEGGPLAMAGIMGGEGSGITLDTTDVFLESAFFAPAAVAGRARRYGFVSEASHRFERGVDPELPRRALERATALVLELAGGSAGPINEAVASEHLPRRGPIRLRPEKVPAVLGIPVTPERVVSLLRRDFLDVRQEEGAIVAQAPSWRFDLALEEDLIEEVARLHGYDEIPALTPLAPMAPLPVPEAERTNAEVRARLVLRDYHEVITYAFIDEALERELLANEDPILLANPIARNMNAMRSSLWPGLLQALQTNRKRQQARVRLFELGRCFLRDESAGATVAGFAQPLRLAALAAGPAGAEQWGASPRPVDFYDLKGDLEALLAPLTPRFEPAPHPALHPGRSARVLLEGQPIGWIGELHPEWVQRLELGTAPQLFELALEAVRHRPIPRYLPVSRQPVVQRDLAFVVDANVPAQALLDALHGESPVWVRQITLFDVYQGQGVEPGKRSLAFRFTLQHDEHTLTDEEIESLLQRLRARLETEFGARLRQQ
ncbi:phenylalanine--tRNA ligase subunit beta [Tepidiphilus margaritifer]|uniref:phenylalanine--tRNA ligase subunit beta n=1 Tax=Tepidiphilus margaritifer TaxID=203471 RepID=UPI0004174168|nr:phenylalanine--tRNA ligase subunit beta [Tepidiphilus margaritifer]